MPASPPDSSDADADALAALALRAQARLAALADDADPDQRAALRRRWPWLDAVGDAARPALAARAFLADGLRLPLAALRDPVGALALCDRAAILRALALLAVARRPGALRACIDKPTRQAMQSALGPAGDALRRQPGRAGAESAAWTPARWACAGFLDWQEMLADGAAALARVVRLCLPLAELAPLEAAAPWPGEVTAPAALALLRDLEAAWPC